MAKKKVTQKSNDTKQDNPQEQKNQNLTQHKTLTHQNSMEDPSEQIQNLKNLNARLLQGTVENRQQVDYLNQAKEALESELRQFGVEKCELLAELSDESEKNVCLEIEKSLFFVFLITQTRGLSEGFDEEKNERENDIRVLKSEVSGLLGNIENERKRSSQACTERDLLKSELDCLVKEVSRFKERLVGMVEKERNLKSEISVLTNDYERSKNEKILRDGDIDALKKEKGFLEKRIAELVMETIDLKLKVEGITRENKEIEKQNSEQKVKIGELEKGARKLDDIVAGLQNEEKNLREKVFELEKSCSEAVDEKEEMVLEIKSLMGHEREKERSIENLMEEKDEKLQRLENLVLDLNDKEGHIAKLLRERIDFEERKVSQESEISGLHKEIGELRDVVFKLKEACRDQEGKGKQLVNEVMDYKSALDKATFERDSAQKCLDEERKSVADLRTKVSKMEKRTEENVKELAEIRKERETLIEQRKKTESRIGLLMEEKELVQKNLLEAEQSANDLRTKMESIGNNSGRALSMLKNTAAMLCQSEKGGKQELAVNEKKLQDDAELYVVELEAIKNAFRKNEKLVENMKQQVELMQNTVVEAHKKKNFWTVVSSATTVFAAASVAYAASFR